MNVDDRIFVAGHRGLVGSAMVRALAARGFSNLVTRTRDELDLRRRDDVDAFFRAEKPRHVFLCAAKVGGILANDTYPADFIAENLAIQQSVLENSFRHGVTRLLFLGSSCIYPRECPQPMKESHLLTGPLEPTNRPYAIAKIAGVEMCWAYNRQYSTRYLAVMPTNLYGPGDNYDLETSHVLPAMIRKMHEAKVAGHEPVVLWGSGTPRREFLYSEEMADASVHLMGLSDEGFDAILASKIEPPLINIGVGDDVSIRELASCVAEVVGFKGKMTWDSSKPDGTPRKLLDVSRLHRTGWRAQVGLSEGIARAYRDFLKSIDSN
ncbi:MAG: GDP-L-fucose synthase [Myxococcota bacterium]